MLKLNRETTNSGVMQSLSNPYVTNLTAAHDKLLGGVYHVGQLYSMEVCDWTARQAAGKTRANTANQEKRPPDPGLGEGGGEGEAAWAEMRGVAILNPVSHQQLKRTRVENVFAVTKLR